LQADEAGEEREEEDETARMFRLAAEQLKEKREEDAMSVEERILKCGPFSAQHALCTAEGSQFHVYTSVMHC